MTNLLIGEQLATERQVAEILQKSVQSLRNDRCLGKGLAYFKIGRLVRYKLSDVEAFIESRRFDPDE